MADILPKAIRDGLYNPQYIPDNTKLNEFISSEEADQELINQKLKARIKPEPDINQILTKKAPLTEAEAEAVDKYINSLQERIHNTKQRISNIRKVIDANAAIDSSEELKVVLDISKKPTVKRAIRKVFGINTNVLTYSMYKAALELKHQIEQDEAHEYVHGNRL